MTNTTFLPELNEIFKTVFENSTLKISAQTSPKEIDNWDSMNHIILISEIENRFNVEFELDDLIAINNVGDILAVLQSKVK